VRQLPNDENQRAAEDDKDLEKKLFTSGPLHSIVLAFLRPEILARAQRGGTRYRNRCPSVPTLLFEYEHHFIEYEHEYGKSHWLMLLCHHLQK
jgi:hypothetical protein